jgi:GAF domain-containing protein
MVKEREDSNADSDTEILVPIDETQEIPERVVIPLQEDSGLTALCALRQDAYNVTDPFESQLINRELASRIGMNPFALAPLVLRGETLGVIGIDRKKSRGLISDNEFEILKVFAAQAAIALSAIQQVPDP